jgi:hypothetical protein
MAISPAYQFAHSAENIPAFAMQFRRIRAGANVSLQSTRPSTGAVVNDSFGSKALIQQGRLYKSRWFGDG